MRPTLGRSSFSTITERPFALLRVTLIKSFQLFLGGQARRDLIVVFTTETDNTEWPLTVFLYRIARLIRNRTQTACLAILSPTP